MYDNTFLRLANNLSVMPPMVKCHVMQDTARQEGRVFVAPYDDPFTIAGQGTIGTEILRQLTTSQLETLHAIFVPVGGGGLIAGIAAYVKALKPEVKIIGVEPSGRF
jgi:threonine dehydratase